MFRASPQVGLVGMSNAGFENEKQIQNLVERNIGALFPGLKFLKAEDQDMTEGERRPDTIAFDTNLDTFVVIEYKNKRDRGVVLQAKTYLEDMRMNKGDLVLAYNEHPDYDQRTKNSFDWSSMYAIIIATEFDPFSIQGTHDVVNVEMYEIEMYDDRVVVMKRVGGAHIRKTEKEEIHDTLPESLGDLYESIHERLLYKFPGSELNKEPKTYNGIRYPGKRYFCTTIKQKHKILIRYCGTKYTIRDMADFEQVLGNLKKPHDNDSAVSYPGGNATHESGKKSNSRTWSGPLRGVPLSEIDFQKAREPPTQVSWNGMTHGGLNSWTDLLVAVTKLLDDRHGNLKFICPVMSGSKQAILNTSPTSPNGRNFLASVKVGELFLNKHGNKETIVKYACKIADAADVGARHVEVLFPKRNST